MSCPRYDLNWLWHDLITHHPTNVRGELVFSVMAASWFCEKSCSIGIVEDVKPVFFITKKRKSDFNWQPL